jgi:hypothetical protein
LETLRHLLREEPQSLKGKTLMRYPLAFGVNRGVLKALTGMATGESRSHEAFVGGRTAEFDSQNSALPALNLGLHVRIPELEGRHAEAHSLAGR